ncbi:MAG: hypothetical protein GWP61_28055 [Chloroflexi bacterium]|nr:hypothetical protein [Chloroflexota bacterium]
MDDWAIRKGQTYGTILIDLEAHQVVDVLSERSAATFVSWLQEHPGVEIISRDRGTDYIKGATTGAPDAIQAADFASFQHFWRLCIVFVSTASQPCSSSSLLCSSLQPDHGEWLKASSSQVCCDDARRCASGRKLGTNGRPRQRSQSEPDK